jgi:MFS family permease
MRALRHRDFRIFFAGALVSGSGSWLQNLTVPFVLFELTGKSLWVGLAGFAQFIPAFILGPLGGSIADRYNRRTVLLITQSAMAVAAFALWGIWAAGWHDRWLILTLTAATGVISGFAIPSWQAFVPSLVPKEDLASAITLNSTQFNAARAIGPALAGLILATLGPAFAFFFNGVSFLCVIAAVWVVRPLTSQRPATGRTGVFSDFGDALRYMNQRTGLKVSVMCAVLVAFFGNPVTQFTVVFAEDVYNAGPRVLGALAATVGVGAVLIAPFLSTFDTRIPRSEVVRWGLPIYALAVTAFGLAPSWPFGLAALLIVGGGFLAVIATTNTAIQLIVTDQMRGRVMAVRVMGFTLAFPLGALAQGVIADLWGPKQTVATSGLILLAVALYLATRPSLLSTLDNVDDKPDQTD